MQSPQSPNCRLFGIRLTRHGQLRRGDGDVKMRFFPTSATDGARLGPLAARKLRRENLAWRRFFVDDLTALEEVFPLLPKQLPFGRSIMRPIMSIAAGNTA